jgi:hypothetical protein
MDDAEKDAVAGKLLKGLASELAVASYFPLKK